VEKATERGVKQRRAAKKAPGPIRWDEIPHNAIWARAQDAMSVGSCLRASEDSLKHVLKRRLLGLNPSVHLQYVELECARIVETLRMVRDEYRVYLGTC
jgi:alkylation response protein AidB-like acyl-CoA dehydrogenase